MKKAYALVQGPRRKVIFVSDSCYLLWEMGGEAFEQSRMSDVRTHNQNKAICRENGAYIVRIDYALGDPITTPRKGKESANA